MRSLLAMPEVIFFLLFFKGVRAFVTTPSREAGLFYDMMKDDEFS